MPTDIYDLVHSLLKNLTFFSFGTHMPGRLWPCTCRVKSQLKSLIPVTEGCLSTENMPRKRSKFAQRSI